MPTLPVVLYEYPFNESMRTMLRLERLFDRLGELLGREAAMDHHFALLTLFEAIEVASRADLKSELLKELDRHRGQLAGYRDNPAVEQQALAALLGRLERSFEGLNSQSGKAGGALAGHEWLAALRSRMNIPGGTCEFDLPAYHAWLHFEPARRRQDLMGWIATMAPLAEGLRLLLQLVRQTGAPQRVVTQGGVYQQSLGGNRPVQLLRLRMDGTDGLLPEITGHRLLLAVRLMRLDAEGRTRAAGCDATLEVALCH